MTATLTGAAIQVTRRQAGPRDPRFTFTDTTTGTALFELGSYGEFAAALLLSDADLTGDLDASAVAALVVATVCRFGTATVRQTDENLLAYNRCIVTGQSTTGCVPVPKRRYDRCTSLAWRLGWAVDGLGLTRR
ncbi:hypothetical protein [Crossiella sp. CA198]|uniref:hypothetical protein n=1 Tax=Crossiella sp. CA198 TaxID=3455607 RepID=UPI003F8D574C